MTSTKTRIQTYAVVAPDRPPQPTYQWPVHLVTAAHSVSQPRGAEHPRVPYGTWHARSVGSLQTVCGLSAVTWHYFWSLEFDPSARHACPTCAAKARR